MIDLAVGARESISFRIRAIGTMALERRWGGGGGGAVNRKEACVFILPKVIYYCGNVDPHLA